MGLKAETRRETPTFSVRFPPTWNHIAQVAGYINMLLEVRGRADGADRVGIVVHELLENAVKYGDPASEVKIELFADAGNAMTIQVTNKAHPARINILERELRRNRAATPHEAFARALERLQHLPEGSTMLGLARVALEATLDVQLTDGIVICSARIDTGISRSTHNASKGAVTVADSEAPAAESRTAPAESRTTPIFVTPPNESREVEVSKSASLTRRLDGGPLRSSDTTPSMDAVGRDKSRGRR